MSTFRTIVIDFVVVISLNLFCLSAYATTQIQFWTMQLSPYHDDYVLDLIEQFEQKNPDIKIKWVDVPWKEMEKKVLAAIAANTAPDVVNLNPQFSSKLAEYKALANPEDYLTPVQIERYVPAIWQANKYQQRSFAIPWYLSTTVTIYNQTILDLAEVEVPTTHAQLLNAAIKIKDKLAKYAYFPAMDGSRALEDMITMGAPLLNATHNGAGFNNAKGKAFFEFYRNLYQQGLVPKNVLTEGHHKAVELFQSGELAFITTGMQFLNTIKMNAPALYQTIGVAPQLSGASQKYNVATMNLAVPQRSQHKKLAFDFAQFVTNPDNQLALAKRIPLLPSTLISYEHPMFSKYQDDSPLIDKARVISAQQVLKGEVLVSPLPKYNKLRNSFIRNLQQAMVGQKTTDEALSDITKIWQVLLGGNNE